MKYINVECLETEIERLYNGEAPKHDPQCNFDDGYFVGIDAIAQFIDSLQQEWSEIDLEKALNALDNAYFDLGGIAVIGATYYLTVNDLKDIARDFYELGLNTRKEQ